MSKISLQDIFNAAWQAFVVEGLPPASELDGVTYKCRYLTSDGRRCAVGLALPEDLLIHVKEENWGFSELVDIYPDYFGDDVISGRELYEDRLTDFQAALHDELQHGGQWHGDADWLRSKYVEVAERWGLKIPEAV